MKLLIVLACFVCMSAVCVTPANAQLGGIDILGTLNNMTLRDKALFVVSFATQKPSRFDALEKIMFAGYPLLYGDPSLKPVILKNAIEWGLDELPWLLQNDTFKDVFHIFVQEINGFNASIANTSSLNAYVNSIFTQMDWIDMILKMAGSIAKPFLINNGLKPLIVKTLTPVIVNKAETFVKTNIGELFTLIPAVLKEFNKLDAGKPMITKTTPKVTTSQTLPNVTSQHPPSIITIFKNSKNMTLKATLIFKFLMAHAAEFDKLQTILIAGLPLLTEQPTLRGDILQALGQWVLQILPSFLKNPVVVDSALYLRNILNEVNITGLNDTNEYEFMNGVLSQIDIIDIASKLAGKVAVPWLVSKGMSPTLSAAIVPSLLDELADVLKNNFQTVVGRYINGMNQIDMNKLERVDYTIGYVMKLVEDILIQNVFPDAVLKPTWKKVVPVVLNALPIDLKLNVVDLVLKDHPLLFKQLQDIIVSALPILKDILKLKPEIYEHIVPWALNHLPKWLESELVRKTIQTTVSELNAVNMKGINMTNNEAFMIDMFSRLDLIHVIRKVATPIALPLSLAAGLKPEIAMHMIPMLLQQVEKLTKTDLTNIMKILITEMNNVNTTDMDYNDPQAFMTEFMDRINVRRIVTGLVEQPNIKGIILSVMVKSPEVILDIVKVLLPSINMTELFSLPSTAPQASQQCYQDTIGFIINLISGSKSALKMVDAFGKPQPGILNGNLHLIGSYEECLSLNNMDDNQSSPKTRYCRATIKLPASLINATVGQVNTFGAPIDLTLGMCLYASCGSDSIPTLFRLGLLEQLDLTPKSVVCSDEKPKFSEDTPAVVITTIMCLMFGLVGIATVFHGISRSLKAHKSPLKYGAGSEYSNQAFDSQPVGGEDLHGASNGISNGVSNGSLKRKIDDTPTEQYNYEAEDEIEGESLGRRLITSFSLFKNARTTLSFDKNPDEISCVHGIRFFSMIMIITGNAYLYNVTWSTISDSTIIANQLAALDVLKRFTFQLVVSSTLATDTFLVVSGFIITYKLLQSMAKAEKLGIVSLIGFIIQRYIRLTPIYIVVLIYYSVLYIHIGDGPTWPKNMELADTCRQRWWYHLLYVNNLVGNEGHTAFQQCMPWSWFNAVLMQLNVITPILIVLFLISSKLGFSVVVLLMAGGITATGIKEHRYGGDILNAMEDSGNYWNHVFTAPWCRVSSYAVGVLLAFVIFKRIRIKLDLLVAVIGWIVAILLSLFLWFVPYLKYMEGAKEWTLPEQAAFESLSRPAWAACVAWFIFACHNKKGGIINSILSWRGFLPFSKLSYAIYLLNPTVIAIYVMSRQSLMYVADIDMIFMICAYFIITTLLAFVMSVVFERPFLSLIEAVKRKSEVKLFLGKDA